MAEAHQAVAFQFAVTDEGVLYHIDRTAVRATFRALWRIFINRCYVIRRTIINGIFPATPLSLIVVSGGIVGLYAAGWFDTSLGLLKVLSCVPKLVYLV